jgi:hypothetical protein
MYVCPLTLSQSSFFCSYSFFYLYILYIHLFIFFLNTHRFPLSIFAYFFRIVVSLCPIQFTFSCCFRSFFESFFLVLSVSILLLPSLNFLKSINLSLGFPSPNYVRISPYLCCIFLIFLFLCLLRLPTFCILNPLVFVPLYCLCVLIIYQHFIVYCLPMVCLSMFIIETVSVDFQEKAFS